MTDPRDPGWRLFPTKRSPPLAHLRFVLTTFVLVLVIFLVSLTVLIDRKDRWSGNIHPDWALWVLVAGVAASLLSTGWARGRPLSATTSRGLFVSYNTRFFSGIAFAESAALFGLVIAVITGRLWPYLVGLGASLVGLAMLAPTARNIQRDEERLLASGSPVSLWDALTRRLDPSDSRNPQRDDLKE